MQRPPAVTGPPSEYQIHSSWRVHYPCDLKKKMCQRKAQWGSRVHQQYKPGDVEYHLWSGAYSISGMSSMSSEKHSTWQVFLKQQRQLNEAQVAQDIVVYMGPLSQGCGKWSQIPQALFLQKMLCKIEKASNASWFAVLSWSQVHLKKQNKKTNGVLRI